MSQHNREFRFDQKMRALIGGGSRKDLIRNVEQGFPNLPPGASATMDAVAQDIVLASIRNSLPSTKRQFVGELKAMVSAGHEPSLPNFLAHTGVELEAVYSSGRSYSDLLDAADLPIGPSGDHEKPLRRALGRLLHIDDSERLSFYQSVLTGPRPIIAVLDERSARIWRMLIAQVTGQALTKDTTVQQATDLLWSHPQVRAELTQILEVLAGRIDHEHLALPGADPCPLLVHARYSRIEIQTALGDGNRATVPDWREGTRWLPDERTDAFLVTLNKAEGAFSPTTAYRDYAMTRTLFHWESQSTTGPDSPTGQRYQTHVRDGSRIMLFARMDQTDRAFWFLGTATYVSHGGARPMAIVWKLDHPIPADLYPDFAAVGVA